jgi:type IV secretion system protein TrbJ
MHRIIVTTLLGLCLAGPATAAMVPVIDAGNIVQSTISAIADVETAIQAAVEVVNSYTQIYNQYQQIYNQYSQLAHDVQNLQQFNGNSVSQLLGVSTRLLNTLGVAQGVSFQLAKATAQFDATYPQVTGALRAGQLTTMRLQWLQQRRSAAATGVQVQAIAEDLQTMAGNISGFLTKASAATGNLHIQQVRAQQEGLTQAQLMQIQQLLAANGRMAAQLQAEEATLEEARIREMEEATVPLAPYTGRQGRLMKYQW